MRGIDKIEFVRVVAGLWQIEVNGTRRDIYIGRQGRNWVVQGPAVSRDARMNEVHHGSARTLRDAKSLAVAAWMHLDTARELAQHEALEEELVRLNRQARELKITYPILPEGTTLQWHVSHVKDLIEARLARQN